jgi:glycosyltransferase involved in cell wall biosynthesis
MPVVTVGLPFYNNENTLLDAIRSVFAQSFEDWELILMDDGSTDGSLEIARSVNDPRVRVISDGQNRKLPTRLNQIHREAAGQYSARLDADDLLHPERLAKQIAFLKAHPEIDLVGTLMYTIDKEQEVQGIRAGGGLAGRGFQPQDALEGAILLHATITGKTQWFRDNPYDETWPRFQDSELWCRTCRQSGFAQLSEPLYFVDEANEDIIRKGLRAMQLRRRLLRIYGPQLAGWPGTLKRYARSYVNTAIYAACGLLKKQDLLVRIKTEVMAPEQREEAKAALERIKATPVPTTTARTALAEG